MIEQIRALILRVDPSIAEGIKWNAPSFRTSEYFATTNLREQARTIAFQGILRQWITYV